jgi:ubiquinone/menaquinone biosynthesis C-methylase UbiE
MLFFSKVYGAWSGIQKEKYEKILELLKEKKISISGKILDVGCGPMFLEKFLKQKGISDEITCIDIEGQNSKSFVQASGDKLPFPNSYFNLAFCIDTIHLIKDADDIHRVLKPGGFAVIASFFNQENQAETEASLAKKLNKFKISNKTILKGKENEIIIIAKK